LFELGYWHRFTKKHGNWLASYPIEFKSSLQLYWWSGRQSFLQESSPPLFDKSGGSIEKGNRTEQISGVLVVTP
jgi:hypothetical protein